MYFGTEVQVGESGRITTSSIRRKPYGKPYGLEIKGPNQAPDFIRGRGRRRIGSERLTKPCELKRTPMTDSNCQACHGTGKCDMCGGSGAVAIVPEGGKVAAVPEAGGAAIPDDSSFTTCAICSGTGKCPSCADDAAR